ncbi:MAG: hypothetical protein V4471_02975 [Pseudomonadota bacterium]
MKKEIFNFNPDQVDFTVDHFVSNILTELLGEVKFSDLKNKQKTIDTCTEEKRAALTSEVLEKVLELKEKIKFTFEGFDVSKKPIPDELMRRSKNILESKILDLLAKGYLVTQIYSLYGTTNENYNEVAEKAVKHRALNEQGLYESVQLLMEKVLDFKKALANGTGKEIIRAINKIKPTQKNGSERTDSPEYKMYKLLVHLRPKKEVFFSAFFKTIHYQASPLGLELLSPSSLSLKR